MPVTRFLCPITTKPVDFDTCLACAASQGEQEAPDGTKSHCHLPYSVIHTLIHAQDHRQGLGVSVTQLTACWRKAWMEGKWGYAANPDALWASTHGTFIHDGLERHIDTPGAWKETRLYKKLANGVLLSGQFDVWWPQLGLIEDYKNVTKSFAVAPQHYTLQQNLYRWMLMTGCLYKPDPVNDPEHYRPLSAPAPITELVLYAINHQGITKVWCPLLDFNALEAWALAGTNALIEKHLHQVPRQFSTPAQSAFCQSYCVFKSECELSSTLLMPQE